MISGQEQPDAGKVRVGDTVRLAYVDQSRDSLDDGKSVYDEVSGGLDVLQFGRVEVNARAYLSWFAFRGADQQKKVGALSGGERNRLHLAKLLREGETSSSWTSPPTTSTSIPCVPSKTRCCASLGRFW